MVADADPRGKDDAVTQRGTACDSALADHDTVAANGDVVADLDQVVDLAAFADDGIVKRTAVDGAARADLDPVLDDDPSGLRYLQVPLRAHHVAEPVLANAAAGMDDDVIANQRTKHRRICPDIAVPADPDPRPDHGAGPDHRSRPDFNVRSDHGQRVDHNAVFKVCGQMNNGARRNPAVGEP